MAFEHNDIATKTRLMAALEESNMGFEHNDIVTIDVMNKAIAEGGGGGGIDAKSVHLVSTTGDAVFNLYGIRYDEVLSANVIDYLVALDEDHWSMEAYETGVMDKTMNCILFAPSGSFSANGGTLTVSGDAEITDYDAEYGYTVSVTGDCTLTLA